MVGRDARASEVELMDMLGKASAFRETTIPSLIAAPGSAVTVWPDMVTQVDDDNKQVRSNGDFLASSVRFTESGMRDVIAFAQGEDIYIIFSRTRKKSFNAD